MPYYWKERRPNGKPDDQQDMDQRMLPVQVDEPETFVSFPYCSETLQDNCRIHHNEHSQAAWPLQPSQWWFRAGGAALQARMRTVTPWLVAALMTLADCLLARCIDLRRDRRDAGPLPAVRTVAIRQTVRQAALTICLLAGRLVNNDRRRPVYC